MRREFSKKTKREALKRSGGECEATGALYGWPPEQRCYKKLSYGVEFDHEIASSNGGSNHLDNCIAVCPQCHKWKTTNLDTPRAAKTVRQQDKHHGITSPKKPWPKRKFSQPRFDNSRQINEDFEQ